MEESGNQRKKNTKKKKKTRNSTMQIPMLIAKHVRQNIGTERKRRIDDIASSQI
jgi:hypothetical protein